MTFVILLWIAYIFLLMNTAVMEWRAPMNGAMLLMVAISILPIAQQKKREYVLTAGLQTPELKMLNLLMNLVC